MQFSKVHAYFRPKRRVHRNYILLSIANRMPPGKMKNWWIRRMGVDLGEDVFISPQVILDPVFPEFIHIGDNVFFGWNARIFTHIITPYTKNAFSKFMKMKEDGKIEVLKVILSKGGKYKLILAAGHIWIEDGAFIGGFTTVRAGVRIGEGATVGSDSLVTKDIPPWSIAVGKPAKIRSGEDDSRGD